jgi:RNA polymerase sigma-70 factor, ECF subfamily
LRRALAALSTSHREVLLLREIEGMSYAEISRVMHCPIGTVMSRLHHARRRMQSQLPDFAA